MVRHATRLTLIVWAGPWSLLGLSIGVLGLATGGRGRRVGPILEFYGGAVTWALERLPIGPMAMTLGHVVIGRTGAALDIARDHEMVHVRQFERWGPMMVPAYFLASFVVWTQGKNAYRDNPFEREAYGDEDAN